MWFGRATNSSAGMCQLGLCSHSGGGTPNDAKQLWDCTCPELNFQMHPRARLGWAMPVPSSPTLWRLSPLQRPRFGAYYADHITGVRFIMIVTSINALCYNMVRAAGVVLHAPCCGWVWRPARTPCQPSAASGGAPARAWHCQEEGVDSCCLHLQIHSLMIKRTSAVTTTVLGEVKIVGLMLLSALLLGECVTGSWEHSGLAGLLHVSCRVPAWAAIAPMRPHLRAFFTTPATSPPPTTSHHTPCRGGQGVHVQDDPGLRHGHGGLLHVLAHQDRVLPAAAGAGAGGGRGGRRGGAAAQAPADCAAAAVGPCARAAPQPPLVPQATRARRHLAGARRVGSGFWCLPLDLTGLFFGCAAGSEQLLFGF